MPPPRSPPAERRGLVAGVRELESVPAPHHHQRREWTMGSLHSYLSSHLLFPAIWTVSYGKANAEADLGRTPDGARSSPRECGNVAKTLRSFPKSLTALGLWRWRYFPKVFYSGKRARGICPSPTKSKSG